MERGIPMVISKYLDSVEGTEEEQKLIDGMCKLMEEEAVRQLMTQPVVGKIFTAVDVLGKCESIAEFKETEHYNKIKDWGISVHDIEQGYFSIYPGPKHMKKICAVAGIIGAGLLLLKLCKCCKKYELKLKE